MSFLGIKSSAERRRTKAVKRVAGVVAERIVQKAQATAQDGKLNASWDLLFGDRNLWKNSGSIWGALTKDDSTKVYGQHAIIFACVRQLTNSFNEGEVEVGRRNSDGQWERESNSHQHPMVELLKRPNRSMNGAVLNAYRIAHLMLNGKAYTWKWRNGVGDVTELWPIPSQWVTPKPLGIKVAGSEERLFKQFDVRMPNGKMVPVKPEDMIYERFIDPSSLTGGIGPLQACYRDFKLDVEKDNYMIEMLENLKVPGIVLHQMEEFDDTQKKELKQVLEETIGKGHRGGPLFLYGEGAGIEFIAPLKDLDWPGLSALNESHICAAFGVPPLLVHARVAQENSPLSAPNLEAAERVFHRSTMNPLWVSLAGNLTQGLLLDEGEAPGGLEIRYDTSEVQALQEDKEKLSKVASTAVLASYMTIGQAQDLMGLEIDELRKNNYLIPMGFMEITPDGQPAIEPDPAPSEEEHLGGIDDEDDGEADDLSIPDEENEDA